ncbi:GntR family transcriptional regulator [Priestia sp. JV24]|uniref:GntR family transcriptional regulator n=1 Tax=Priestia TaxID=2800373 RepID=UPI0021D64B48|nr:MULTISPECIES: GntR family transcriptional regulator [Priestia]MCU7712688.1 GntR family transcriptional regulator [Priestia megaterium]MCW1049070.1 GntR family transcriptional regulator [Priestia sp. JV24]
MKKTLPKKEFLKDQAYNKIKELLTRGELSPGEFLSEGYLSEELGMSRTPIRSAIQRFEHEGIVRIHPKQGIYICDISIQQVNEIYEARSVLETFAIRKLSHAIKQHQIQALQDILTLQFEEIQKQDIYLSLKYDTEFHLKIMELAENKEMYEMFKSIEAKLSFYGQKVLTKKIDRLLQTYEEHLLIVTELEKGNVESAVHYMEEHLEKGRRILLDL